jgi:hypothetical protein
VTQSITSARRYYLLKRQSAAESCEKALESVWRAKQEAEPGTALPTDFPYLERLTTFGYTTLSDLDGCDACELEGLGFARREAAAILTEFETLTTT